MGQKGRNGGTLLCQLPIGRQTAIFAVNWTTAQLGPFSNAISDELRTRDKLIYPQRVFI
jgi:hypothetical protein